MKLDARLMSVAKLVRKDKIVADIGTDHAYLPVYLVENKISKHVIASDVRKGPLENARKTVSNYNLLDNIELRLSDGLNNFSKNEVEEIIISGMGGLLISQFISRTDWLKSKKIHIILQPMTHSEELRKTLYDNGFFIDSEIVSVDNNKQYIAISAYYSGNNICYTDFDLVVGKLPENNDKLSSEYLKHIYNKYYKKLVALKLANKPCDDIDLIVRRLEKWQ